LEGVQLLLAPRVVSRLVTRCAIVLSNMLRAADMSRSSSAVTAWWTRACIVLAQCARFTTGKRKLSTCVC